MACLIDAEGSIFISKVIENRVRRGYMFVPRISVSNSNLEFMQRAFDILGVGNVGPYKDKRNIGKAGFRMKDRYMFHLNSKNIRLLLPQIIPFLIVKKKRAQLMLKYLALWFNAEGKKIMFTGEYPPEVLALYHQIKLLNRKGQRIEVD